MKVLRKQAEKRAKDKGHTLFSTWIATYSHTKGYSTSQAFNECTRCYKRIVINTETNKITGGALNLRCIY